MRPRYCGGLTRIFGVFAMFKLQFVSLAGSHAITDTENVLTKLKLSLENSNVSVVESKQIKPRSRAWALRFNCYFITKNRPKRRNRQ